MYIRVVNINSEYHARLFNDNDTVLDEMSCKSKDGIGWICREMLRWQSKMGSTDPWAESARERSGGPEPVGVKYIGAKNE